MRRFFRRRRTEPKVSNYSQYALLREVKFHSKLRLYRYGRQLTLQEAASRAGIDKAHLSRVERGKGSISVEALGRLGLVLGLSDREIGSLVLDFAGLQADGTPKEIVVKEAA